MQNYIAPCNDKTYVGFLRKACFSPPAAWKSTAFLFNVYLIGKHRTENERMTYHAAGGENGCCVDIVPIALQHHLWLLPDQQLPRI